MYVGAASLPVRADAVTDPVRLAPAPGGRLFAAMPAKGGTVLVLLDARGKARPGWPLLLRRATGCGIHVDLGDGSVRAICGVGTAAARAYALDRAGRLMAGWPVELPRGRGPARVVVGDLYVLLADGESASMARISRDGSLRQGAAVRDRDLVGCCAAIGPDATGYLVAYVGSGQAGEAWQTMLTALDLDGLRPGYPLKIDGSASVPAFGTDGRVYVAVDRADYTAATGNDGTSQVMAIDAAGRIVNGWPVTLPIDTGFGDSEGIGAPLTPLVAPNESITVVSGSGGTTAYALDPTGKVRDGWPFTSRSGVVAHAIGVGGCPSGCGMCGLPMAGSAPQAGRDGTVYIAQRARGDAYTGGNRIVAVGVDGDVRAGWPVTLTEKGAWFVTFAVGGTGVAFGYAVEPAGTKPDPDFGTCRVFSGTVVALDGHGDPVYTTTLVVP